MKTVFDCFPYIGDPGIIEPDINSFKASCSPWGNDLWAITDEHIEELKKGKVLRMFDGEYCTFVVYKGE